MVDDHKCLMAYNEIKQKRVIEAIRMAAPSVRLEDFLSVSDKEDADEGNSSSGSLFLDRFLQVRV